MIEVLRVLLGVVAAASLVTIVAYVLVFAGVVAWTVLGSHRRDRVVDELDEFLAKLWDQEGVATGPLPGGISPPAVGAPMRAAGPRRRVPAWGRRFS